MPKAKPPTLGESLRAARTAAGLTQESLADRSGVHVITLSELERGVQLNPSIDLLRKIAGAIGGEQFPNAVRAYISGVSGAEK